MTLTLKDLNHGDCWMYCGHNAPDRRPSIASYHDEPKPADLSDDWDDYGLPTAEDLTNTASYFNCNKDRPIELLEHYTVSPSPKPLRLKRGDLVPGDCFQYLVDFDDSDDTADPYIVEGRDVSYSEIPDGWLVSTARSARDRMTELVRRVPHWTGRPVATPAPAPAPVVLSCVDPFKDLRNAIFVREVKHVDGLTGKECLARFEMAQQTETLARPRADVDRLVCTNAACGLTLQQVEHARDLWSYMLRLRVAEKKAADAERERTQVVCEPNYVDD